MTIKEEILRNSGMVKEAKEDGKLRSVILDMLEKGITTKSENIKRIAETLANSSAYRDLTEGYTIKEIVSLIIKILNEYGGHFAGHYGVKKLASKKTEKFNY